MPANKFCYRIFNIQRLACMEFQKRRDNFSDLELDPDKASAAQARAALSVISVPPPSPGSAYVFVCVCVCGGFLRRPA